LFYCAAYYINSIFPNKILKGALFKAKYVGRKNNIFQETLIGSSSEYAFFSNTESQNGKGWKGP